MARPRAADDFETIRARLEELRQERDQALRGQTLGSTVQDAATAREGRGDNRRFPRLPLLRKLLR